MNEPSVTDENAQRGYLQLACPRCGADRLCVRVPNRHGGHFLLSVFTLGTWIPIWVAMSVYRRRRPYCCMACGKRVRAQRRTAEDAVIEFPHE